MTAAPATPAPQSSSSPAFVALAWIIVLIPLAWGVYNTVKTSANLFNSTPPTATMATTSTMAATGAAK